MEMVCPAAETYHDVEKLIHKVVHTFLQTKNLNEMDYEEWYAEANVGYARSYRSFDRKRGNRFTTWLWHGVWNALSDRLAKEAPHAKNLHLDSPEWERFRDGLTDDRSPDNKRTMLDIHLLSQDARTVVEIVLGTFGHIDGSEKDSGEIRLSLDGLLQSMGWSGRRVLESFGEIRVALTK